MNDYGVEYPLWDERGPMTRQRISALGIDDALIADLADWQLRWDTRPVGTSFSAAHKAEGAVLYRRLENAITTTDVELRTVIP